MAFADGMRQGQEALRFGLQERRLREQDARAAELHGMNMDTLRRNAARERGVDDAVSGLQTAAENEGLTPQMRAELGQRYGMPADRVNSRMTGLGVPYDPEQVSMPDYQESASTMGRRGMNAAKTRLAVAQRDTAAMDRYGAEGQQIDLDSAMARAMQAFDRMDDGQIAEAVDTFTRDAAIPGFGTWVGGARGNGYLSYQPKGGDAVKLSRQETRDLFLAHGLMQSHPQAARKLLNETTERARVVARELFAQQTNAADAHNKGVHYQNQDANDTRRTSASVAASNAQRDAANNQLSGLQMSYRMGADGRPVPVMTGVRFNRASGRFETVESPLQGGAGLIPQSALDPRTYSKAAEAMVGQPTGGLDATGGPAKHTLESATEALMRQGLSNYGAERPGAARVDPARVAAAAKALGGADKTRGGATPTQGINPSREYWDSHNRQVMQGLREQRARENVTSEGNLSAPY
jgi:hypothetical protein